MSVEMKFATFMKYLTLSEGDKIRELQKYAKPGGFDFYKPSREAIPKCFVDAYPVGECKAFITLKSGSNNEGHNQAVFDAAHSWGIKQKTIAEEVAARVWHSPNGVFSVRIEPEFLIDRNGTKTAVAVYPRANKELTRDTAGAGIVLLSHGYLSNEELGFGVLDVHAGKAYWTPTSVSAKVLDNVVRFIDENLPEFIS